MAKYEIMTVINGTLSKDEASGVIGEIQKILKNVNDLNIDDSMGLRDLAYPIKKINKGFYYVFRFSSEDVGVIAEFRRVVNLNKYVIRHLIINLEKDYAYKATINPKKIKRSQFRAERYNRIKETIQAEQDKIRIEKEKDSKPVRITDI